MLLILDNCEHVIAEAAGSPSTPARLRPTADLATSREPLRIPGEQTYRLPSFVSRLDRGARLTAGRAASILGCDCSPSARKPAIAASRSATPTRRSWPRLPPARRYSAGHRTRRRARERFDAARRSRRSSTALADPDQRRPHRAAAASDDARAHRLELRPARPARTAALRAAVDLCRRMHVEAAAAAVNDEESLTKCSCSNAVVARRQVAGRRRSRRPRTALPAA